MEAQERKPVVMLVGIGAVVLILFGAALLLAPRAPRAAAPSGKPERVSLVGQVVAGEPLHLVRAFPGGLLAPGEQLRLRARISSSAYLLLLAQRAGSASEPLWPSSPELRAAGEVELVEGEEPLTLDRSAFARETALVLLACPEPVPAPQQRTPQPLFDPASIAQAFPACSSASLRVAGAP